MTMLEAKGNLIEIFLDIMLFVSMRIVIFAMFLRPSDEFKEKIPKI